MSSTITEACIKALTLICWGFLPLIRLLKADSYNYGTNFIR